MTAARTARPVVVRAPAKVNLHLSVGARRGDGYHDLNTVFLALSLYDRVTAHPAAGLQVSVAGEGAGEVPLDEGNLAWRAAVMLAEHTGVDADVHLELVKAIPVAAGLAGGSADAAATLVACDALWGTDCDRSDLLVLAARLGSDVSFALTGGLALGAGRGEVLSPVLARGPWHVVLAIAADGLSTATVYAELDRLRDGAEPPPLLPTDLLDALRQGAVAQIAAALHNDLQAPALSLRPGLRATLREGAELGALAGIISGSGPTCAFLASSAEAALRLAAALSGSGVCRAVRAATGPVPGARIEAGR